MGSKQTELGNTCVCGREKTRITIQVSVCPDEDISFFTKHKTVRSKKYGFDEKVLESNR